MDTQAFQHLLALFPLLILRQHRVAQPHHYLLGHLSCCCKNPPFRWCHRSLKAITIHQAIRAEGIVEVDKTDLLKSFKRQQGLPGPARRRGSKGQTVVLGQIASR